MLELITRIVVSATSAALSCLLFVARRGAVAFGIVFLPRPRPFLRTITLRISALGGLSQGQCAGSVLAAAAWLRRSFFLSFRLCRFFSLRLAFLSSKNAFLASLSA